MPPKKKKGKGKGKGKKKGKKKDGEYYFMHLYISYPDEEGHLLPNPIDL